MKPWIFELIALAIVLACAFDGMHRGFVKQVFSLVRVVVRIALAIGLVVAFFYFFKDDLGLSKGVVFIIALVLSSIMVYVIERLLGIVNKIPLIKTVNKIGGLLLGLLLGLLVVWLLMFLIHMMKDTKAVHEVATTMESSKILSWIEQFNPLLKIFK